MNSTDFFILQVKISGKKIMDGTKKICNIMLYEVRFSGILIFIFK
jgi:hypothetical protein